MNFLRLKIVFVLAFCLISLTGCNKANTQNEIVDYVSSNLKLTSFKVSPTSKKTVGEDNYTDYEWTVTEEDGSQFTVVDDYYYGQEWVTHTLRDNRNYLRTKEFLKSADCSAFQVEEKKNGILGSVTLIYKFTDRKGLQRGVERMNALSASCPPGLVLFCDMEYDHPYRSIGAYTNSAGDTHYVLKDRQQHQAKPSEDNMLSVALDMRYDNTLREFSDAEIHALVRGNQVSFGVKHHDGMYESYDDLLADRFFYGISFPTLYEVLRRNGYEVSGMKDRYSFKGIDGSVYEFSNDFTENGSYYYIKDGKHVPMEFYFYNHWRFNHIKQMTGIECEYCKAPTKKENNDAP